MSDPYLTCSGCGVVERSESLLAFKHRKCREVAWSDTSYDVQADMEAARVIYEQRAGLEFRGLGPSRDMEASVKKRIEQLIANLKPAK